MAFQDESFYKYRAALISIGAMYEDYEGPIPHELVAVAQRLIEERNEQEKSENGVSQSRR